MTTRDFFRLMLKVFGLYFVIVNLFSIPSIVSFLFYDFNFLHLIGILFMSLALIGLYLYLLFTPDKIIDLFKLERHFDSNKINLEKLDSQSILKIGIIMLAGIFFLDNAGELLTNIYLFIKATAAYDSMEGYLQGADNPGKVSMAIGALNLIISWLLITNCERISEFLLQKKEDSAFPGNDASTKAEIP